MSSSVRITATRKVSLGSIEPGAALADVPARPTFEEVSQRWKGVRETVRGLPWSKVPDDLLRDYLAAMAGTLEADYGNQAWTKGAQMMAGSLLGHGLGPYQFALQLPGTPARLQLEVLTQPDVSVGAPSITLEGDMAGVVDEEAIRGGLSTLVAEPEQRLKLEPISHLPADVLRALVSQIEVALGHPTDADGQLDVMVTATAALLMWGQAERMRAETVEATLSGLHDGDRLIAEGQSITVRAICAMLDPAPEAQSDEATRTAFTVRHRPS